jgi:hypothetical protein
LSENLSNDASHKLHAAVVSTHPTPDKQFQARHIEACRQWYEALSASDQMVVASAIAALSSGKSDKALEIVAILPAAPTSG